MNIQIILYSMLTLGVLGLIFGISLAVASKIFYVKIDERVEKVLSALPDLNCGACGYAGCMKYASAVVNENAVINLCAPGGHQVAEEISAIIGVEASGAVKKVAFSFCSGGDKAKIMADYHGINDCESVQLISGGHLVCEYGCLRFYSCIKACAFDAIFVNDEGLPEIDFDKCTGCMACVKVCPRDIIKMVPDKASVFVECNSPSRGKEVMDACSRGCIGCTKCVKVCPVNAISMQDGLAVIDQDKCVGCSKCVAVCPIKVIHKRRNLKPSEKKVVSVSV